MPRDTLLDIIVYINKNSVRSFIVKNNLEKYTF